MRRAFGKTIVQLAEKDENIFLISILKRCNRCKYVIIA